MRIFLDRLHKQLQIVLADINLLEYKSFEVYKGIMSPLEDDSESVLLKTLDPISFIFVDYTYSYFQTGNIYLVGVLADDNKKMIDSKSITAGTDLSPMYNQALKGLQVRKDWFSSLRSEKAQIYFKSLERDCSCWDEEFNQADPNCNVCGGTGRISGYVGKEFDVMVGNDYKKTKILTPEGRKMSVEGFEAWIFEFPFVNDECILIRKNGDRYTINDVSYKHFGGQLIEMSFVLVMLSDSFDYKFKLLGD